VKKLATIAIILLAVWWLWSSGKRHAPGVLVSATPKIELIDRGEPWKFETKSRKFEIVPRAKYVLEARVLSVNTDYGDTQIGPLDVTVGWGRMSDQSVLDRMQIWQDNTRHWYVQPRGDWPIPYDEVALSAVNTHVIPATPALEKELSSIGKGDVIALEGYLVNVNGENNFHWNTSVDPSGFGEHSCKIIWVEKFRTLR